MLRTCFADKTDSLAVLDSVITYKPKITCPQFNDWSLRKRFQTQQDLVGDLADEMRAFCAAKFTKMKNARFWMKNARSFSFITRNWQQVPRLEAWTDDLMIRPISWMCFITFWKHTGTGVSEYQMHIEKDFQANSANCGHPKEHGVKEEMKLKDA